DTKNLQNSLEESKKEIANLKQNPVPLGFIYVQLSNQPEPKTMWSAVTWKDVTSEYAGQFFRAEGGGAAPFGQIQGENVPRITDARVEYHQTKEANNHKPPVDDHGVNAGNWWDHITMNVGGWSSGIGLIAGKILAADDNTGITHSFYT